MTDAVRTRTSYSIKGIGITLEAGQAAASDVELAKYLGCNRKTVGKLIDGFNLLGMLTTETNNRTSIHTLHFLTGWYVDGVLMANPHYVRPSATAKGEAGNERTPYSGGMHPQDRPSAGQHDGQSQEPDRDSKKDNTAASPSSLCPAGTYRPSGRGSGRGLSFAMEPLAKEEAGCPPITEKEDSTPGHEGAGR